MKRKTIQLESISDEEEHNKEEDEDEDEDEEEDEDGDRRNSLRKKRRIRYTEEEEDEEEEGDEDDEEDEEDQEDNEQPDPSIQNSHSQRPQENRLLPVTCGDKKGTLDVEKLNRGEECIQCEGRWFVPHAFEDFGGKGSSKKWKVTIFHEDKPLQNLFESGTLSTKGFKRRGTETTKPKKILSSNLDSESTSEESKIQSAEGTEEDDVIDDNWRPGSEVLSLETEEGEEERVGSENGGELVDTRDDKSKEEGGEMEKGEMEDEPAVTDDSDNSVSEERETKLIISASQKNALQSLKVVIKRLQVDKSDCPSKCTQHPEQGSWCNPLDEEEQSEKERQHNSSTTDDPSVADGDISLMSDVPPIGGGVKEEREKCTQTDARKDGLIAIKTETVPSPTLPPTPATSSPDIQPDTVNNAEDNGSISDHTVDLSASPMLLVTMTSTGFAGDMITDWEEKEDGELDTDHCGTKERECKRQEHADMLSSEASDQPFATGNIRDVASNTVTTQQSIKDKDIEAMSPPTKPQSEVVECEHDNPGHTDATTYGHDAAQLQVMKLETRDPQTTLASDSSYSSDSKERLSPSPSASINLDIMDLDQLKREKIKMQLKVLKLQEEYYTLKIKEFKK